MTTIRKSIFSMCCRMHRSHTVCPVLQPPPMAGVTLDIMPPFTPPARRVSWCAIGHGTRWG